MSFIAQLGTVIAPKEFERLKGIPFKTFGELCENFINILKPKFGTETNLKLVGATDKDGNFVPRLPYFLALNKQGEVFVSDNFIGENLFFTEYDLKRKEDLKAKKPTDVDAIEKKNSAADAASDTASVDAIDFNSLK